MNPIVPYENDNPRKPFSPEKTIVFWEYLYKKGQMARILLYLISSLFFLLLLAYLVREYSSLIIAFTVFLYVAFIFYIPSLPGLYRVQFKGKFRSDIPEEELRGLLIEATGKSLELASIILVVISVSCIAVYEAAKFFLFPDSVTLILLTATVLNILLISLISGSLGRANRYFLRKIHTEEEYTRYTRLSNYKRIIAILIIVNLLSVVLLYMVW